MSTPTGWAKPCAWPQALGAGEVGPARRVAGTRGTTPTPSSHIFRHQHQVYNNAGIAYNGNVDKSVFMTRAHHRRRLLGRRQRHQSLLPQDCLRRWDTSSTSPACSPRCLGTTTRPVRGAHWRRCARRMLVARHPVKVTCVHPGGIKPPSRATPPGRRRGPADVRGVLRPQPAGAAFADGQTIVNGVAKGQARSWSA